MIFRRPPTRHQFSTLCALLPGRERTAREVLAKIPVRDDSPFARVPGTHNGRWTVVRTDADPGAPLRAGGLPEPMLMCSAVIDEPPQDWLPRLLTALDEGTVSADDIWSNCPGWPAARGKQISYLLARSVPSALPFATVDHPVAEIVDALAVHRQLSDFAARHATSTDEELLAAYRAELGGAPANGSSDGNDAGKGRG